MSQTGLKWSGIMLDTSIPDEVLCTWQFVPVDSSDTAHAYDTRESSYSWRITGRWQVSVDPDARFTVNLSSNVAGRAIKVSYNSFSTIPLRQRVGTSAGFGILVGNRQDASFIEILFRIRNN